jgi:APA family basic amino acid/polyamine antiporter
MTTADLFRKKTVAEVLAQSRSRESEGEGELSRQLTARDLTALGVAAIVGAGIFSTIGTASADGGPGVVLLFLFTAIACTCTAFAYAEFASMVPAAGSAYTYSYVAFGELVAWIIGWALIMEYSVGNVTVAVSWSDYFSAVLRSFDLHIPEWAAVDYVSAGRAFRKASLAMSEGQPLSELDQQLRAGYLAWKSAPTIGGFRLVLDIPAIVITLLVTRLVYLGIRESRNANNVMVAVKLSVIFFVIVVGAFFIDVSHWTPFVPNGVSGILTGVSAVFFAYIGFDAISTTAEECRDPARDLPRGIMYSIAISTTLYVLLVFVLTGIVPYYELRVGDPLAYVFSTIGLRWFSFVVALSAVVAMASVLLVFQLAQPRIWLAMSRDGLLPEKFATIHPRHRTPSYATIVTAVVVIVTTLLIPAEGVLHLCSMGTLVAFALVCAGVLKMQQAPGYRPGKFRTPYVNARHFLPLMTLSTVILLFIYDADRLRDMVDFQDWARDQNKIPKYLFFGLAIWLNVLAVRRNLSLIPTLGLLFSCFMMAQIPFRSWIGFAIWLLVGLAIYFAFGRHRSRLAAGANP